jgi:hypothetical protein
MALAAMGSSADKDNEVRYVRLWEICRNRLRHDAMIASPGKHDLISAVVLQFMDFCKHYKELRSMGFPSHTCAGALMAHPGDFAAATEACLAAQQ